MTLNQYYAHPPTCFCMNYFPWQTKTSRGPCISTSNLPSCDNLAAQATSDKWRASAMTFSVTDPRKVMRLSSSAIDVRRVRIITNGPQRRKLPKCSLIFSICTTMQSDPPVWQLHAVCWRNLQVSHCAYTSRALFVLIGTGDCNDNTLLYALQIHVRPKWYVNYHLSCTKQTSGVRHTSNSVHYTMYAWNDMKTIMLKSSLRRYTSLYQ